MKKLVSTALLASLLAQLAAPLAASPALADGGNPFGKKKPTVGCVAGSGNAPKPGAAKKPADYVAPSRPTPLAPPAEPEVILCAPEPEPALANLPPFQRLVRDYITAFYADDSTHKLLYGAKIKKEIFKRPGSPEYVENLLYLDTQSAQAPEAVYDLARSMQLHWEAQFAMGMSQRKQEGSGNATKIGAVVGMAVLGACLLAKPSSAPRYFSLFRHLAPVAGLAAGTGVGHVMNASGYYEKDLPASPASLMRLGISSDEFAYDESTLGKDLLSLTASMAAMGIAYDVLKAIRVIKLVNAAATPAKINPYALVGSIIISLVVEQGVEAGVDWWQYRDLKNDLIAARLGLDGAADRFDDYALYLKADALMKRAVNLATYVNRPLQEAMQEFTEGAQVASRDYKEGTPEFKEQINTLTRELSEKVRNFQASLDSPNDPDYEISLVLGFMRNHDEAGIAALGPVARKQAEAFQSQFNAWLERSENSRRATLPPAAREKEFRKFVSSLSAAYDRRLAQELSRDHIRRDGTHILLQAASYLRATGKEYVEDQADALMAIVSRNDLMMRQAGSDEAAVAGIAEQDQRFLEGPLPPGGVPTPSTPPKPSSQSAGDSLDGGAP